MKTKNDKQLVVGLDIGTSKVVAIVGEYEPGEPIEVIGIGTLVFVANGVLLASYTFSCHSFRHFVGGRKDCLSEAIGCGKAWATVSAMNRRHGMFAWFSLFSVGFTDVYVRLCSMGVWHDWRIL